MAEGNIPGAGVPAGLERLQRLTVHIRVMDKSERHLLYMRILQLVKDSGTAWATVVQGDAGYSISGRPVRSGDFGMNPDMPLMMVIVDRAEQVETLLPRITAWVQVNGGMVTLEDLQGYYFPHQLEGQRG
jgi:PII-like signaling protein